MSEQNIPEDLPDWISDHIKLYLEDPGKGHDWDTTPAGGQVYYRSCSWPPSVGTPANPEWRR